jgi:hypothetical protein
MCAAETGKVQGSFQSDNSCSGSDSSVLVVGQNDQISFRQDQSCWKH